MSQIPESDNERERLLRDSLAPQGAERVDVDAAWTAMQKRLGLGASAPPVTLAFPKRRIPMWAPIALAASLVFAVAMGVWYPHRTKELVAGPGERLSATLDDGSIVTLNAGSRLRFPRRFWRTREVQLDGEAQFEVTHDAARPFRVVATNAVATDLGTRFVVRAYPELRRVDVGVTEGRVSLKQRGARDSVTLVAGMVGHLGADGTLSTDSAGVPVQMTAWLDGTLAFSATPLADVAAQLRRRFGTAIRFEDPALEQRRISTSFRNENLTQVFDAISLALGISYERRGDTVVVRTGARP